MKITYLLGAGASAKSLPVVTQIPHSMKEFAQRLNQTTGENFEPLKNDILDLVKKLHTHISIDTYAKKLFLTRKNNELKKLKFVFSVYFLYLNLTKVTDNRYDLFLATIIQDKPVNLPKDFRIVSWNYDFQLEKALSEYSLSNNLFENQQYLNVYPPANYKPKKDCFTVYKLNGTTFFKDSFEQKIISPIREFGINEGLLLRELVDFYNTAISAPQNEPMMHFAWEDDSISKEVIEAASDDISDTEILVVIGYSFPQFNREIDRRVFGKMYNLTHIYFQALPEEVNFYKDRFESIYPNIGTTKVKFSSDLNSFVYPFEL